MSDLVVDLRSVTGDDAPTVLELKAAREIERLRLEVAELRAKLVRARREALVLKVGELREALVQVGRCSGLPARAIALVAVALGQTLS